MTTFLKGLALSVVQFAVIIGIAAGLSDCGHDTHGDKAADSAHGGTEVATTPAATSEAAEAGGGGAAPVATGEPTGVIKGLVKYNGDRPPLLKIGQLAQFKGCLEPHQGKPVFKEDAVIVGEDGTLENVFISIDKFPKTGDGKTRPPVVLDQKGCVYTPHIIGVMANQKLEVRNSDSENHNINVVSRQGFNQGQAKGQKPLVKTFRRAERKVPVKCNVHPWMNAVLFVMNHPHFSVAGKGGTFAFPEKVPPGTYTLVAEHEKLGKKTQQVEVVAGENTFTFEFP